MHERCNFRRAVKLTLKSLMRNKHTGDEKRESDLTAEVLEGDPGFIEAEV